MAEWSRRTVLGTAGAVGVAAALGGQVPAMVAPKQEQEQAPATAPARAALERLLPEHADQFRLTLLTEGAERFTVVGGRGRIEVAGTSPAVILAGVHWYLKYECDAVISWAGSQLDLPRRLPAPSAPMERAATVAHRFVFNDTYDGYTAPYADWARWERTLDVLALHGCNEVFLTAGHEAVYQRMLQEFGYSDAEIRAWVPAPTHQPWWLLQNMSVYGGPISPELIAKRAEFGRKAADRLRELGMAPVFPGYYGTVPPGFTTRNPGAKVVPQGIWSGFQRPDWLDPRTDTFATVAASFYKHQRDLFGATGSYKMDILHEGGSAGDVNISDAALGIEKALQAARPGAKWVILGWQGNPRPALLDPLDKKHVLIVDGRSELDEAVDRETDWKGAPYCFGAIPNFGGRTTLGALASAWTEKFPKWRDKAGSSCVGTAYMPVSTDRDPAALELFTEMAWREETIDHAQWFERYAQVRYGRPDQHAADAFAALRDTVYQIKSTDGRPHDSIFAARPDLSANSGTHWATHKLTSDPARFDAAFGGLLAVHESLRNSEAYRYDLTDVARQSLANRSWQLLPQLEAAYGRKDLAAFKVLAALWLKLMRLSEEMTGGHSIFMLGPWLEEAKRMASTPDESAQLERTARVLITTWGDRASANDGLLANYANRDWQGLIGDFHLPQWQAYLDELEDALTEGRAAKSFDWYAIENPWTYERKTYPLRAMTSAATHRTAQRVHDTLARAPYQGTVTAALDKTVIPAGGTALLTAGFRNVNGLRATGRVRFALTGLDAVAQSPTSVGSVPTGGITSVGWQVAAPAGEVKEPLEKHPYELRTEYGPRGEKPVTDVQQGSVYVAGPLAEGWKTYTGNDAYFGQVGERFAIDGAGRDMWGSLVEFGTIYRKGVFKDGTSISVAVDSQANTGGWARAGLAVRNAMATPGSKGFISLAVTPANGVALSFDSNGDGTLDKYQRVTGVTAPVRLRLTRTGTTYTGAYSTDGGTTWTTVGTVTGTGAAAVQDAGFFMSAVNGGSGARGRVGFSGWSLSG
ncbi:alpha-N-acetylglucosaminidase [Streptomyces sp. NPDC051664]|uniref:alpha-N-acetylglucosaminidase n=1 Tax=Streptomyces sp. NPDC051664 TaxID=3365668 RepID=UPI0037A197E7